MKRKNRRKAQQGKNQNSNQITIEEQLMHLAEQHGLSVDKEVQDEFKHKQPNKKALKSKISNNQIKNPNKQKLKKQKIDSAEKISTRTLFSDLTSILGFKFGTCSILDCKCNLYSNNLAIQGEGSACDLTDHTCTKCTHALLQHEIQIEIDEDEFKKLQFEHHLKNCFQLIKFARLSLQTTNMKTWVLGCVKGIQLICWHFSQNIQFIQSQQQQKQQNRYLREVFGQLKQQSNQILIFCEGIIGRHESVEITVALDEMYFRIYYYFLVAQGRKNCNFLDPLKYFQQIEKFNQKSEQIFENFLQEEISEESQNKLKFQMENKSNDLIQIQMFRVREGIRIFYEEGIGFDGELDKILQKNTKHQQFYSNIPCYQLLQSWRDICRKWCCHLYSYATPNEAALKKLSEFAPLVEVGAGTGYWASLLNQKYGCEIICYDTNLKNNQYHADVPSFYEIKEGGVEVLSQLDEKYSLFLCYPPQGEAMARLCLKNFKGKYVIHVGEWQGDTGDARFEFFLQKKFVLTDLIKLQNWGDTAYSLTVWKRRDEQQEYMENQLFKCTKCGDNNLNKLRRCKLCRDMVFCSEQCASSMEQFHDDEHAVRLIFLKNKLDFNCLNHFGKLE